MGMLISKEEFCNILNNIQQQKAKEEMLSNAIEEFTDSWFILKETSYEHDLLLLLKKIFNDEDDYISWWLFEDVDKVVWINDDDNNIKKEINLDTPEQLYDFLVSNYEGM